jgi:hypothetical protein
MRHHRWTQAVLVTAAVLTSASSVIAVWEQQWAPAILCVLISGSLAEIATHRAHARHDALTRARMALEGQHAAPEFVPCCQFWTAPAGHIHAPDCPTWSTR